MPESRKVGGEGTADRPPTSPHPVSAVRLPAALTERIDSWALAQALNRADAIECLIELGLKSQVTTSAVVISRREASSVEDLIASQIDHLIDPSTSPEERDRRIHRLMDGPPEFVGLRIDLPKRAN